MILHAKKHDEKGIIVGEKNHPHTCAKRQKKKNYIIIQIMIVIVDNKNR